MSTDKQPKKTATKKAVKKSAPETQVKKKNLIGTVATDANKQFHVYECTHEGKKGFAYMYKFYDNLDDALEAAGVTIEE